MGGKVTGPALAGLGRRVRGSGEPEDLPGRALDILRSENGGISLENSSAHHLKVDGGLFYGGIKARGRQGPGGSR